MISDVPVIADISDEHFNNIILPPVPGCIMYAQLIHSEANVFFITVFLLSHWEDRISANFGSSAHDKYHSRKKHDSYRYTGGWAWDTRGWERGPLLGGVASNRSLAFQLETS